MTDWAIDEAKTCFNGLAADVADLFGFFLAFNMRVSAEFKVNGVGIFD